MSKAQESREADPEGSAPLGLYGLGTVIAVPSESPSGSWFALDT